MKSQRKMLLFHTPEKTTSGKSADKYVAISDIHRIEAVPESWPTYGEGSRSIIYCRGGKDAPKYHATESAADLVREIEAK